MSMRKVVAVLGAATMLLGAAACGSDDDESAEEVPEVVDQAAEQVEDEAAAEDETAAEDEAAGDDDGPMSGMPEDFEGCLTVGLSYAGVYLSLLGDEDSMSEAMADLEEIKGEVPDEIADDLDVIIQGLSEADGIVEAGEFMETDEYIEADANVTAFLDEACGS